MSARHPAATSRQSLPICNSSSASRFSFEPKTIAQGGPLRRGGSQGIAFRQNGGSTGQPQFYDRFWRPAGAHLCGVRPPVVPMAPTFGLCPSASASGGCKRFCRRDRRQSSRRFSSRAGDESYSNSCKLKMPRVSSQSVLMTLQFPREIAQDQQPGLFAEAEEGRVIQSMPEITPCRHRQSTPCATEPVRSLPVG
jgi:hypothetical protein